MNGIISLCKTEEVLYMLRIIVGQDPYPNPKKRLQVNNYPFNPVSFWQNSIPLIDDTFNRFISLVNAKGNELPDTQSSIEIFIGKLAEQNYYFFNVYQKYPKQKLIDQEIISFIDQKLACNNDRDAAVLLVGVDAKEYLYAPLKKKLGEQVFNITHPSPKNPYSEIVWDNPDQYFRKLQKLFQI